MIMMMMMALAHHPSSRRRKINSALNVWYGGVNNFSFLPFLFLLVPLPPFALLQRGFDDDEEEASLKGKVRWGRDSIAALGLKF